MDYFITNVTDIRLITSAIYYNALVIKRKINCHDCDVLTRLPNSKSHP